MLYEKITTPGGRTTYRPLSARRVEVTPEMANALFLILIGATIVNLENNLPEHSRTRREIATIEKSLQVIGGKTDPALLPVAWGALDSALAFVDENLPNH